MTVNEEDFSPPDHNYSCDACGSDYVMYVMSKKSGLPALVCRDCRAYVSCHRETYEKMGYMAHPQIRAMRRKLHYIADPLWMKGLITREYLYVLLSHAVSKERTHIGDMTYNELQVATKFIRRYIKEKGEVLEKRREKKIRKRNKIKREMINSMSKKDREEEYYEDEYDI